MNHYYDELPTEEEIHTTEPVNGLDSIVLGRVLVRIIGVCLLLFPKVYLNNQIYFESREISILTHEHDILSEENRQIRAKVESLKYQRQIASTLFALPQEGY